MALVHGPLTGNKSGSLARRIVSAASVLVALALVAAAMFMPVVQSSDATTTGYTIRQHQQELSDLEAQIHQTENSVAALGTMSRIQTEARRLGMILPGGPSVRVTVSSGAAAQTYLPRRYLPPLAPAMAPPVHRGIPQQLLHTLFLH